MMGALRRFAGCGLLFCLLVTPARADEPGAALDDVTMEVVEESDADEGEYVDEILLPGDASSTAQENSAFGIGTANEARDRAREDGRAFGESTADEARRMGRDADNAGKAVDGSGDEGAGGGLPENLPVQVQ